MIGVAIICHKFRLAHIDGAIQSPFFGSFCRLFLANDFVPLPPFFVASRKREEASDERAPSKTSQAGAW
jgi:hypothetical protein